RLAPFGLGLKLGFKSDLRRRLYRLSGLCSGGFALRISRSIGIEPTLVHNGDLPVEFIKFFHFFLRHLVILFLGLWPCRRTLAVGRRKFHFAVLGRNVHGASLSDLTIQKLDRQRILYKRLYRTLQ